MTAHRIEVAADELEEMAKHSGATISMGGPVDRLTLPNGKRYFSRRPSLRGMPTPADEPVVFVPPQRPGGGE